MTDDQLTQRFYRSIYLIRKIEEEIARIYPTDKIKSPIHLSIGQEAVAVGVCEALNTSDYVFPTYRGHATYIAKGGNVKAMIAELYGKSTGCARGKGGSMHLIDPHAGVMGASAVVGTNIPLAVGAALSAKLGTDNRVSVAFFGDGAVEEGVFHESMNFAGLKKLPILFVCENNDYAIHTPRKDRQSDVPIYRWAESYGIESSYVPDGDVSKIYSAAAAFVSRLRSGEGPFLLECSIYRWKEHVGPNDDFAEGYRDAKELDQWIPRDPLVTLARDLSNQSRSRIIMEVEALITDAFDFAQESPVPDATELLADLFQEAN